MQPMMSQDFQAEEGAWRDERSPRLSSQTYQMQVEGVVSVDIGLQQLYNCVQTRILSCSISPLSSRESEHEVAEDKLVRKPHGPHER